MFCGNCGAELDTRLAYCGNCGAKQVQSFEHSSPHQPAKPKKIPFGERTLLTIKDEHDLDKKTAHGCLIVATAVFCAIVLIISIFLITGGGSASPASSIATPTPGVDAYGLMSYAETFVTRALKAPATAVYPGIDDWKYTDMGNGLYYLTSYVDSENSFGANLRSKFAVEFQLSADGDTSIPLYLNVGGTLIYDNRPTLAGS